MPHSQEFMDTMTATMERGIKLKKVMLEKGLTLARATCTINGCDGFLVGRLVGRKSHLHMRCTKCSVTMME